MPYLLRSRGSKDPKKPPQTPPQTSSGEKKAAAPQVSKSSLGRGRRTRSQSRQEAEESASTATASENEDSDSSVQLRSSRGRGRGRPTRSGSRQEAEEEAVVTISSEDEDSSVQLQSSRGRGRGRPTRSRQEAEESVVVTISSEDEDSSVQLENDGENAAIATPQGASKSVVPIASKDDVSSTVQEGSVAIDETPKESKSLVVSLTRVATPSKTSKDAHSNEGGNVESNPKSVITAASDAEDDSTEQLKNDGGNVARAATREASKSVASTASKDISAAQLMTYAASIATALGRKESKSTVTVTAASKDANSTAELNKGGNVAYVASVSTRKASKYAITAANDAYSAAQLKTYGTSVSPILAWKEASVASAASKENSTVLKTYGAAARKVATAHKTSSKAKEKDLKDAPSTVRSKKEASGSGATASNYWNSKKQKEPLSIGVDVEKAKNEVDPNMLLDPDVEEDLAVVSSNYMESVMEGACLLAKHRGARTVELQDVQLYLRQNENAGSSAALGGGVFNSRSVANRGKGKRAADAAHRQRLAIINRTLQKH